MRYKIGIFSIVVIAVLGFIVFTSAEEQEKNEYSNELYTPIIHFIVLTKQGFKPQNIVINKGDTIEFSTDRDRPFWTASNLHPTHTIFPAFDSLEPIPPDLTWSFIFTDVGKWGFHDHLQAHFTGVIEVVK